MTRTLTDLVRLAKAKGETEIRLPRSKLDSLEVGSGRFLWEPQKKDKDPTFHFWLDRMAVHISG